MFKGGSIKPVIIAFLAINAILIAYSFPYLVFAYENRNLNGYGIHYDAEPVRVESDAITFEDKLSNMTMVMDNYSYVYVNDESINSGDFAVNLDQNKAFNSAVDGFIDIFMDAEYLKPLGLNKRGIKTDLSSKYEHYINMYLIIRPDTEDMYLAWDIIIYFENGNVELIVDDETGKVMSGVAYIYDDTTLENIFKQNYLDEKFGTRLANYYGMKYVDSEYSRMVSISNNYSSNSTHVARTVQLMADDPDDDVELSYILRADSDHGFVVYFNYFSYSTVNVDVDEDVEDDTILEYNTVIGDDAMKDQQNSQDFISGDTNASPEVDPSVPEEVASSTDAPSEQVNEVKPEEQKNTDAKPADSKDSGGSGGTNVN